MGLGLWNVEWLNLNSQRAYPLADHATATDRTGAFRLPESFLLGLYWPVHHGVAVDPTKFFVRRVVVFAIGYSVSLGYDDGSDDPPVVGSAVIAKSTHAEGQTYALAGVGDFDDSVGKVVVGALGDIDLQPAGEFTFDPDGGALDTDCVRPIIRGVSSLTVVNGNESSGRLAGDIRLVAGTNVQLSVSFADPAILVRVDAIDGAGLTEDCDCTTVPATLPPIRTINGIGPKPDGDFDFVGNDCLDIAGLANGLQFRDTCSQPCCGCPELEALTGELAHMGDEALTLRNYVANLKGQMDNMEFNVLGSRLGDNACVV